jgi:outer membrane protein
LEKYGHDRKHQDVPMHRNSHNAINMKTLFTFLVSVTMLYCTQAAELKIGTVDVQRLFKEYYRAEEVSKNLETRRQSMSKELSELRLDGNRLLKEAHDLQESSLDNALSQGAKEEKKRSLDLKLADLRAFELQFDQTRAEREDEFQNYFLQANKRVSDEISDATRGIGEKDGFNLILNLNNKTDMGLGEVVFTKNVADVTDKVLASLNATKPITNGAAH